MKYKHCPAPFFNHFIEPSPLAIAKLKFLHCVLRCRLLPLKWSHPFVACPPFHDFKIPPSLYALASPINMTTMIRQNTKFPLTARSPTET